MSVHAYPMRAVIGDYARAAGGVLIAGAPLATGSLAPAVAVLLAAMVALFALYGAATLARHLTRFEVSDRGVRALGPRARAVAWGDLASVKLSYFSTRRDRGNGWLQLRLAGAGGRLAVDSRLEGFDALALTAARAAREQGVDLDETTVANFEALGVRLADAVPAEAAR